MQADHGIILTEYLFQVDDEDLASLLSLGYNEEMARRALRCQITMLELLSVSL